MSFQKSVNNTFIPASVNLNTDNMPDLIRQLESSLDLISSAVNDRIDGSYFERISPTGGLFEPRVPAPDGINPNEPRTIYRKMIETGELPNNTTKSIAHNIDMDASVTINGNTVPSFRAITIYGSATQPDVNNPISMPLPNPEHAYITVDGENINITTLFDGSLYTESHIIIEYILN